MDLIPEGAMPLAGMRIVTYTDQEGKIRYRFDFDQNGPVPVTQIVGVMEMVKHEFASLAIEMGKNN